ncbi:RTA1 like protein-domain-containing protein [Fusarium redolens]|uniref:RTA1 like protein-domain-containing protein n=1 Tax=Fusarium redolens TaxID=48865 RepID=A0A9P9R7I8_FUSRE|nr:RTA1 like protein-domain-containing protein [Fusarium redolens]KAH7269226.1 RTA1 like protein-domain-containing protein [Fusarium redolens]
MNGGLVRRGELLPYKGDFYLWRYVPSIPAAVIFIIVFLVLSAAHTWKMIQNRLWFCIPFVIGGFLEVIGFIGRAMANKETDQLGPYILQSVFLLIPPSLFAASIYMTLGRIMRGLGPKAESCSIIRVKWLTTLFVVGDIFSFLVQSSGAGMMAAGDDPTMGENIVIGGLVIQILFFGLFVVAAVIFHLRYRKIGKNWRAVVSSNTASVFDWERMLMMLYATSALILIRCFFRIVEYVMGADAYPLKNEWTLYIFDSLLMAAVMVIFYIWYPSRVQDFQELQNRDSADLAYVTAEAQLSRS